MKTNAKSFLILFFLITVALVPTRADFIKSTYIGPSDGNWGDPANWSPAIVPNNGGGHSFAATIANVFLTLDLDVTVNRLTFKPGDGNPIILGGTAPLLFCLDHDFTSAHTKVGYGGIVYADAESKDVTVDLGELADFSGTTLGTGNTYYVVTAEPGRTATMKFDGANIATNTALVELIGANARLTDENGADALAHFRHNAFDGYFDLEVGRNFTTEGSFVNEGLITVIASDPGSVSGDIDTTLTINGSYTGIGSVPPDPNFNGQVELIAPGPDGDARMIINGALTNYDAGTQTLHKSLFVWEAAHGARATTLVLGGGKPFDIVTSEASLSLFGPKTGFRDRFGNNALRNLAVSARLLIGDRDFTTATSFTSTSRLSVFGDCRFTVSGHLTIRNGFFEVSPLELLAGGPGFPTTPYKSSQVIIRGNFNLPSPAILLFHVLDHKKTATVNVKGAAVFAGSLQVGVEKIGRISASDSFTVLTAASITGQFSNVMNGGRVDVFGGFDQFGTPTGTPIGTFLVTYNKTSLTLSDFQRN